MTFQATIHAVKIDGEGEGTLTLKIPASDLAALVSLTGETGKVLEVDVRGEE
jgi:hypothetical protein